MKLGQSLITFLFIFGGASGFAQTAPVPGNTSGAEKKAADDADEVVSEAEKVVKAEVAVTPGSREKSLLKTAGNANFNKALYFDQINNGVILPPMELEYDLSGKDGKVLKLGDLEISDENFSFSLVPLEKGHPQLKQVLGSNEGRKMTLMMKWPEKLLNNGTLEMISRNGNVLWTHTFTDEDREEWKKKQLAWRKALVGKGIDAKKLGRAGIFGAQFGIIDLESAKAPFWGQKEYFRFCLAQTDGRNSTKICSQRYGVKSSGSSIMMGKVRVDATTPRVLVNNEEAPLKKIVPVSAENPTAFFAELSSGESYEFVTVPNSLQLMDIAEGKEANTLRIVGFETRPTGPSVILNKEQYGYLTTLLGFEPTIGDKRQFWATTIQKNEPQIYLPGRGGGIFKQRFELSELPRAQSRIYLSKRTPIGTYIDGVKLEGRKQPISTVSTDQNSVAVNPKDPASFVWNFRATERGKINRSYLNVDFNGKTYRSYYEMYKGFPRELSGRFTGVAVSGDFAILGEVAYNQWFEDLFGWQNYWVSRQRWGVSAKYFQSFNQLKVDTAGAKETLTVLTVDAKYRATPGLWGREESVGAILSYQSVTFKVAAPMLGVGAFWARSMPRSIDNLFNYLPFMSYPKWVDMEFLYYVSPLDSNITLNSPMSLNFHGKVLWTDRFFGEAGFGMKRYSFSDKALKQEAELNTFYGTVGLGLNF